MIKLFLTKVELWMFSPKKFLIKCLGFDNIAVGNKSKMGVGMKLSKWLITLFTFCQYCIDSNKCDGSFARCCRWAQTRYNNLLQRQREKKCCLYLSWRWSSFLTNSHSAFNCENPTQQLSSCSSINKLSSTYPLSTQETRARELEQHEKFMEEVLKKL